MSCPNYKWADDLETVWVTVLLPADVTELAQIKCVLSPFCCELAVGASKKPVSLKLSLAARIDATKSTYTFNRGAHTLVLELEKVKSEWWPQLQSRGVAKPPQEAVDWEKWRDPPAGDPLLDLKRKPRRVVDKLVAPIGFLRKIFHTLDVFDVLLLAAALAYLVAAPWTKVEESFNVQATHDLLFLRSRVHLYDHLKFPGFVARTFVGPLVLALLSAPAVGLASLLGAPRVASLAIVRAVLALLVLCCFKLFRLGVALRFGGKTSRALTLVTLAQFHLLFYISRPLANTFAMCLSLLAFSFWFSERYTRALCIMVFCTLVFRGELVLLFAPIIIQAMYNRRLPILWGFFCIAVFSVISLLLTVPLDSYLWGRLLWPEGTVLFFNVVENKSHMFGVSPWAWYWYSALPRLLLGTIFFVPVGLYKVPSTWRLIRPVIFFIFCLSFLGHKETRFILYVVPLINVVAAVGLSKLRSKGRVYLLLASVLLLASLGASALMGAASSRNYPGGAAIQKLHELRGDGDAGSSVWMCNLALQTGVSRYNQQRPDWYYSKEEDPGEYSSYKWVISESPQVDRFTQIAAVEGYTGLQLRRWPPRILMRPRLYIHENDEEMF